MNPLSDFELDPLSYAPRSIEADEWHCPQCRKIFRRRVLTPEETRQRYGFDRLKIEVEGPDARRFHLAAHRNNASRKLPTPRHPRRQSVWNRYLASILAATRSIVRPRA